MDEFVRVRRVEGLSWRRIEKDIWTATAGQVDVHATTLRSWYPELIAAPAPEPKRRKGAA